jgi:glycosyltransferase involved in cell wall biosynthesis
VTAEALAPPRVTIGMPVYNGGRYLREAVEAALGQTFRDLELVISDNASTDGVTEATCREFAARDPRVRYYRNATNMGASWNYNRVVALARGAYFKWTSANDTFEPEYVAKCVEVLDRRPDVVLCYGRTLLVDDETGETREYADGLHLDQPRPSERWAALLSRIGLNNAMNGVVRLEVLRKTAGLAAYTESDVNLMAELALHGKFHEIPEPLFRRRVTPAASTQRFRGDLRQIYAFYDPKLAHRIVLPVWRQNYERWRAIRRAPIPRAERAALYRWVLRNLVVQRGRLVREVASALGELGRRVLHPARAARRDEDACGA